MQQQRALGHVARVAFRSACFALIGKTPSSVPALRQVPYDIPYVPVEKTTVYLPKDVKRRLRTRARERGVSEAQLIREGLDVVLAPRPRFPLFHSGTALTAEEIDEVLAGKMGMDGLPPEMRERLSRRRRTGARSARR